MFLIVGLGNPTKQYEKTRHNIGFDVMDALADKYNISISENKHKARCGKGMIEGMKVVLAKPQTYMNLSGHAVRKVKDFYKVEDKDILICFDDLDIPFGEVRYKESGSGGSHNGMKNIVQMLDSKNMPRLRIGIGNIKHENQDLADFVLEKFNKEQLEKIGTIFDKAYEKFNLFIDK